MKNENDDEDDDVDHEDADDDDDDDDGDDDDVIYMMIRRVPKRCAFQSNARSKAMRLSAFQGGGFQSEDCIRNCQLSTNSYIFFHAAWTTPRKHCKLKSHMALVDITNVKNIW